MKTLFLFFTLFSVAQAEDTPITIINPTPQSSSKSGGVIFAVGEAQVEKDRISILSPLVPRSLSSDAQKELDEFHELLLNDFSFYKSIFDIKSGGSFDEDDFRKVSPDTEKTGPHQFRVQLLARPGSPLSVEVSVLNVKEGKEIFYSKVDFSHEKNRAQGHQVAQDIYQKITGKPSIFTSQIVFVSDHETKGNKVVKELYIMDFDGKNRRQLTHHRSIVISPAMSHDKKKIVYSLIDFKKRKRNIDLYLMDLESGESTVISNQSGLNTGAVFLPGDKEIALTLSQKGNADIFVMDLKTKALRALTTSKAEDVDPAFSADGSKFTFLSDRSGKAMVYTASPTAAEKNVTRVSFVGQFNATPRFSPLGDEIAFASWVDNRFDIYRMSSDSNKLERLTKSFGSNEDPSYSRDGKFILFSSQRILSSTKAVQNLYIMGRDGDIIGAVLEDFGNCSSPRWSN